MAGLDELAREVIGLGHGLGTFAGGKEMSGDFVAGFLKRGLRGGKIERPDIAIGDECGFAGQSRDFNVLPQTLQGAAFDKNLVA